MRRLGAIVSLLVLCGLAAGARAVTLDSDSRFVQIMGPTGTIPAVPNPHFAPFVVNVTLAFSPASVATQNSQITSGVMVGAASAAADVNTHSFSRYDVTFTATTTQSFSFTGQLSGGSINGAGVTSSVARLTDLTAGGVVLFEETDEGSFSGAGTLVAGHQCRIEVVADANTIGGMGSAPSASFSFTFKPIAAATLLPYEPAEQ